MKTRTHAEIERLLHRIAATRPAEYHHALCRSSAGTMQATDRARRRQARQQNHCEERMSRLTAHE